MIKAIIVFIVSALLLMVLEASALEVSLSDQGTGVTLKSTNNLVDNGNLEVFIYDNITGGNLIFSEMFTGAIINGSWNVMLGENATNPLDLDYGKVYYKDYEINGVDVDFLDYQGNTVERKFFYSPLGGISTDYIIGGSSSLWNQSENYMFPHNLSMNIGIGTENPQNALNVIGNGNFTGSLIATTINGSLSCSYLTDNTSDLCTLVDTDTHIGNTTAEMLASTNATAHWASTKIQGTTYVCIGTDCRSSWPYGGGNTSQEIWGVVDNGTFLKSVPDVWVNESGDTMTGNLVMNGANVTNVSYLGIRTEEPEYAVQLEGGNIFHSAGYFKEIAYIQDDNQGGKATYLDKPRGLRIVGKYLYALSLQEDAFCIYDISDPEEINEISCIVDGAGATALDGAKELFVLGKYAYVLSNVDDALSIFDISDPSNITEIGYIQDDSMGGSATGLDGASSIFVSGRYAYLTSYNENAVSIFDVSDPSNPVEVSVINNGVEGSELLGASALTKKGNYLYVLSASTSDSLSIFDITDPQNPMETDYIQDDIEGGNATHLNGPAGIYVSGRYAYVTAKDDNAFSIFDISNKSDIVEVSSVVDGVGSDYLAAARGIILSGRYAYVTAGNDNAIVVFNIMNASDPYEVAHIQDDGNGGTATHLDTPILYMDIAGKYLYVAANADDAITAIEVSGTTTPAIDTGIVRANSLYMMENIISDGSLFLRGDSNIGGNAIIGGTLSVSDAGNNYFAGNVGIGTVTPQNKLNVIGDVNFTGGDFMVNNSNLYVDVDSNTVGIGAAVVSDTYELYVTGQAWVSSYLGTGGNILSGSDIYTTGSGDDFWLGTSTQASSQMQLYADGTLNANLGSLYVDGSTGYVGIGTVSPNATLHVLGNITATNITVNGISLGGDYVTSWPSFGGNTSEEVWAVADNGTFVYKSGDTMTGNLVMSGNITPGANDTYSLGSPDFWWKDIYVGSSSLYIGGKQLTNDNGVLKWGEADISSTIGTDVSGQGLVLGLNFNGQNVAGSAGSETVLDGSGFSNHAENNGAQYQAEVGFNGGGSFAFDGLDDYMNAGNSSSINVTGSVTVSAWVKAGVQDSTPGEVRSLVKINDTSLGGVLNDTDLFGAAIANIGDLDGDGVTDLAVSSKKDDDGKTDAGAVYILFMGINGSVKSYEKINDTSLGGGLDVNDLFSSSIENIGDLDGDGIVDLAVGAIKDDDGKSDVGAVWILFMESNGSVKSYAKINDTSVGDGLETGDQFGNSIISLGDLDGDGVQDLAVGARMTNDGGTEKGAIWMLFLYTNASVKSYKKINETDITGGELVTYSRLGTTLVNVGDLDGDGVVDIVSGEEKAWTMFTLFLYPNGSLKTYTPVNVTNGSTRISAAMTMVNMNDMDNDGITDLAIGDGYDLGTGPGYAEIFYMQSNGSVKNHTRLSSTSLSEELEVGDYFGVVENIGDFDNDGLVDLAVGSRKDDDSKGGYSDTGAVYILYLEDGLGTLVNKKDSFALRAGQDQVKAIVNGYPVGYDVDMISGWNHLALVSNGTGKTLYVNGEAAAIDSAGSVAAADVYDLLVGKYFNGSVDDVRIYDRALSGSEIDSLYQKRSEVHDSLVSQREVYVDADGNVNVSGSVITTTVSISEVLKLTPGSVPANPQEGWIYMNSTDHYLYYYNSTDWVRI